MKFSVDGSNSAIGSPTQQRNHSGLGLLKKDCAQYKDDYLPDKDLSGARREPFPGPGDSPVKEDTWHCPRVD